MLQKVKTKSKNNINKILYETIDFIYNKGYTLDEACSIISINRQKYYYICKKLNVDSIVQSSINNIV